MKHGRVDCTVEAVFAESGGPERQRVKLLKMKKCNYNSYSYCTNSSEK